MIKKILLVDDVKLLIEIQKNFLASSYVTVLTANDGVEALETARRERPDLIIMDKYMPNMDGLTCCKKLKEDPSLAHIPIIMATNATRDEDAREYRSVGCADILSKPINSKVFLATIKKYIPDIECRNIRIPLKIGTNMHHGGASYSVLTQNLSLTGLFAVTEIKPSVDDEIRFSFTLPGLTVPLEVKGRVVWHGSSGGEKGVGVEFKEVTGQGMAMLRISELKSFINSFCSGQSHASLGN